MPSKNAFDEVDDKPSEIEQGEDEIASSQHNQNTYVKINTIDVHKDITRASEQLLYFGHKLGLNQLMSPLENLLSWCRQQNIETEAETITATLDELGLTGLEDIAVKNLSAGQQRRVALAKLWLKSYANLWVLDEPFTALDVNFIAVLEQKITAFLKSGGAVLMTSHQALNIDYPMTNMHLEYQW
jgi:heme exporter protein A